MMAALAMAKRRGVGRVVRIGAGAAMVLALTLAAAGCGSNHTAASSGPQALWVVNEAGSVVELKGNVLTTAGVSVPTVSVVNSSSALDSPLATIFDSSGNEWVANSQGGKGSSPGNGGLVEFKAATLSKVASTPAIAPDVTITDDGTGKLIDLPAGLTFEGGDLVVANFNGKFVTEYLPSQLTANGSPTPNITLTDTEFVNPAAVAFDSAGDLFVSDQNATKIWIFKAATVQGLAPGTNSKHSDAALSDATAATPVALAFDSGGNLWVADFAADTFGEIYEFSKSSLTAGATAASAILTSAAIKTPNGNDRTLDGPVGLAFDSQGNLWFVNEFSADGAGGSVGEFAKSQLESAAGTTRPTPNIYLEGDTSMSVFNLPVSLAFGPPI